jgi:hypothetical protein
MGVTKWLAQACTKPPLSSMKRWMPALTGHAIDIPLTYSINKYVFRVLCWFPTGTAVKGWLCEEQAWSTGSWSAATETGTLGHSPRVLQCRKSR